MSQVLNNISLDIAQKKVDNALACFEEGLNVAGYVPLFGICKVSGVLRAQYGQILICGSVAAAVIVALGSVFAANAEDRQAGFKMSKKILMTYASHGLANIGRAALEVSYLSLFTCLLYDMTNNRYKYPTEKSGKWVYVTN